ncbi:fungal-specific transcription factor domain-containing protein [Paraphoma chrysanthemicola]|uniref:Fungal-specific transcription factor domain-containing protein n=1 Tax=Paraphoma chrysanthemicola TaxID=798071 RepID=A0A8K0R3U2_9PLEO|nr:fungal-specific transcription factor domain-containing protein [Paraphoma chrysanthemicola]
MDRIREDERTHRTSNPQKRPRKQRPCYSCEECRRLKMKCNREVPCSNCVRRNRARLCNKTTNARAHTRQESAALPGVISHRASTSSGVQAPVQHPSDAASSESHNCTPNSMSLFGTEAGTNQTFVQRGDQDGRAALLRRVVDTSVNIARQSNSLAPADCHVPSNGAGIATVDSNTETVADGEDNGSYGTLMLSNGGLSVYLGPTAGSEWLKDSETQDVSESSQVTHPPSPAHAQRLHVAAHIGNAVPDRTTSDFPFSTSTSGTSTGDLLASLPPREEAWTLIESYYRYCAWHHDVAPRAQFEKTFDRVYSFMDGTDQASRVNPQEIALVSIVMAQGTMFNIEMPHYDTSAEDWVGLAERALVKGDFLSNNTVAGLQTLHLMAHLHLNSDKDRQGDNNAWPLWGLVMRLAQAMGMHRDGSRWNLPQDVIEERRKVFWECNAADVFQAHCFSRPCAINPDHCDTQFPSEPLNMRGEKGYTTLRLELSQLSAEILNMAMSVRKPAYSEVVKLDSKLCIFERNLPFYIRSRAAFLSMPSRYPDMEAACEASPEPSRRSMILSFQQMSLALNISETFINLHRPYYARALYGNVDDSVNMVYGSSFLTVIERCAIIINMVTDIHARFPAVSTRQWHFWFHVFGSALCLGTLLLRHPNTPMFSFILAQIDAAITLFTSLIRLGAGTPRYRRNLKWLSKLRARVVANTPNADETSSAQPGNHDQEREATDEDGNNEDVELLGWRTRLIERGGQARRRIRTINLAATPPGSHVTDNSSPGHNRTGFQNLQAPLAARQPRASNDAPFMANAGLMEDLLHDFWDPMLLQDIFEDDRSTPFYGTAL